MAEKTGKIYVKWVRSGIGFPRQQREKVRSLGLRHLNQVVERPDTVPFRGLVASVPHLVKVVDLPASPAWSLSPEYKIVEPPPVSAERASMESSPQEPAAVQEVVEPATTAPQKEVAPPGGAVVAPSKGTPAIKAQSSESDEEAPAEPERPKRKRKVAKPKATTEE